MPIKIKPVNSGAKRGAMTTGKTKEEQKKELERQQRMRRKTGETAPMEPISKKSGGKMPMVTKNGKRVPAFAADGVGKMNEGGMFRRSAKAAKDNKSGSYKIKSGDTLSQIAKARGTTVKKLMEMNPSLKNANMIRAGASLNVPPKTEVSKITGSKKSPYRGMSSKEITSGTMRKSPSKTSAKQTGKAVSPKSGSSKPYSKSGGASSEKPKGRLLDRFMPGKAESRKKAREEIPVAAKKGGAMKKYKSGGMTCRGMGAAKKGGKYSRNG